MYDPHANHPSAASSRTSAMATSVTTLFQMDPDEPPARQFVKDSALHTAVRNSDMPLLEKLLKSDWKHKIDTEAEYGETSLHLACAMDNLDAVKLLLRYGATHKQSRTCYHALHAVHLAASEGAERVLEYLLTEYSVQCRVPVEELVALQDSEGSTPLHWAVQGRRTKCVEMLLDAGARVNQKQTAGLCSTPLHLAGFQNLSDVLQMMTSKRHEEFMLALPMYDDEGLTVLHRAAMFNSTATLSFLLDQGCDVELLDKHGRTATQVACAHESWAALKCLVHQYRADPYHRDALGRTCVHSAAFFGTLPAQIDMLCDGLRVDLRNHVDIPDKLGYAALHYAAVQGDSEAFTRLVDLGADWKLKTEDSRTVLHLSAEHGSLAVIKKIIKYDPSGSMMNDVDKNDLVFVDTPSPIKPNQGGLRPPSPSTINFIDSIKPARRLVTVDECVATNETRRENYYGRTQYVDEQTVNHSSMSALNYSAMNGHTEVVKLLLRNGAMTFRDSTGQTPLHNAASQGNTEIISLLLQHFPNIKDYPDLDGNTALHLAAAENKPCAVTCLLKHAAVLAPNKRGRTPIDISVCERHLSVTNVFIADPSWRRIILTSSYVYGTVAHGLTLHAPEAMKIVLSKCIVPSDTGCSLDPGFSVVYDFSILEPPLKVDDVKYERRNVLKTMSKFKRSDLINHPLTRTLLERKWRTYGVHCQLAFIVIYLTFLFFLTYLQIEAVRFDLVPALAQIAHQNVKTHSPQMMDHTFWSYLFNRTEKFAKRDHCVNYFCVFVVATIVAALLLKECIEFHAKGYRYFMESLNYLEVSMCGSCITYLATYLMRETDHSPSMRHRGIDDGTFQIGAIAIFLAWFNFLRYCQPFAGIGIYAVMFFAVLKTLLQAVFLFFILAAAFTMAFHELIPMLIFTHKDGFYEACSDDDLNPKNLKSPHFTLYTSALRIAAMLVGEVDISDNYVYPLLHEQLPFPIMTIVMVNVFIIMMAVLLNNLLTGLAVGDTSAIMENAGCLRLQCQIDLHFFLEHLMPSKYKAAFRTKLQSYKYYPNRREPWLDRACRLLSGSPNVHASFGTSMGFEIATGKSGTKLP